MTVETVTKAIQLILAPVVMVTACGIMLSGLLGRYAAINDRLRALARERLECLRTAGMPLTSPALPADPYIVERLREIDTQIPQLLRRHRLAHNAVLAVYGAVLVFILCMFVIAIAVQTGATWIATAALLVFLAGTAVLLIGLAQIVIEVQRSQDAVEYEVRRVAGLRYGAVPDEE